MSPKTSKARPTVAANAPGKSRRTADGFRVSGTFRRAMKKTAAAIGRFTKKTARQDATWTSHPPTTGPTAPATAVSDDHVPTARPRSRDEKAEPRIARLDGTSSAAPIPCTARAATSHQTPGASAQAAEDAAKTATPIAKIRRRPNRSASEPPTRTSAERKSAYASTTHCTLETEAWRSFWSTGSATLTTVPSMKAMLEPRIVAARTHRDVARLQGDGAVACRMASSQGPLAATLIAVSVRDPGVAGACEAMWQVET